MNDFHRTPNKKDKKPAAQPENEDISPSPETDRKRLSKQEQESGHMKKLFATLAENTQKQLREQGEKTRNGNCGHEMSQLGHTQSFNNKDNTCPKN
jgi:hypothetical protein